MKLVGRDLGGPHFSNDNSGCRIGQPGGLDEIQAGGQGQGENSDDRIAGAGDIIDGPGLGRSTLRPSRGEARRGSTEDDLFGLHRDGRS